MDYSIEVYEKFYYDNDSYSEEWWEENMPKGSSKPDKQHSYRRTMLYLSDIKRPIEIPNNKNECILLLVDGEEMTIKENYDFFCIKLNDLVNGRIEHDFSED